MLIHNFIDEKGTLNIKTPKIKSRSIVGIDAKRQYPEDVFYEKNLENFRGKEMTEYQNDVEKNLKIEQFRLKSYKRYKQRLLST